MFMYLNGEGACVHVQLNGRVHTCTCTNREGICTYNSMRTSPSPFKYTYMYTHPHLSTCICKHITLAI